MTGCIYTVHYTVRQIVSYLVAYDQAITTAQRALTLATAAGGEVGLPASANYYLGLIYQAQGDNRRAVDYLVQTMISLDLGLGTLYARINQPEPARAALSTALALYRSMAMTFWLPQAEAALAQIEAGG